MNDLVKEELGRGVEFFSGIQKKDFSGNSLLLA